jgi:hypothetical protein
MDSHGKLFYVPALCLALDARDARRVIDLVKVGDSR